MQIVIKIPEKDIPKRGQGMITVHIDFHTGELCRCTYPCKVIPKGHGDLIDRDDLLADSYCIDDWSGNEVNIIDVMTVKMADVIIKADKEK